MDEEQDSQATPPCNIEAEKRLLQHLLHPEGSEAIEAVKPILTSEPFYNTAHQEIYGVIVQRHDAGLPVDDWTAEPYQEIAKHYPKIGDMPTISYLDELKASAESASIENAVYYANEIRDKSILRDQSRELHSVLIEIQSPEGIAPDAVSRKLQGVITAHRTATTRPDKSTEEAIEVFPEIRQDFFNDYLNLFEGVTESPKSYHVFCFAVAVGMMLGRNVYVAYPHELYPNIFALLIGRPGVDRKDTAMNYGRKLAEQIDVIQTLPAIASYEGLLEAMSKKQDDFFDMDPSRTLVVLSEFNALLKKARVDSTSNIIPNLCHLYDCPGVARSPTKVNPIKVDKPFLSILSSIQPGVIQDAFRSGDIHSGFAGRWAYVSDQSNTAIPLPGRIDNAAWNDLVKKLSQIRDIWKERKSTELKLSDAAVSMWEDFYRWHREQNQDGEIINTLIVRIPEQILKLAMIFAALDDFTEIHDCHLEDAINIGKWLIGNTKRLFAGYGRSEVEKAEEKIQEILKGGPRSKRDVQQYCRFGSALTFSRAFNNLVGAGLIEEYKKGRRKLIRLSN